MLIECEDCEARVDAKVQGSYEIFNEVEGMPYRFSLLMCPQCQSPSVAIQEIYSGHVLSDPDRLYPRRANLARLSLPASIQSSHQEALNCFKAKAYSASVIMCRKSLESMCTEHGVKAGSLAGGLNELKEAGVIEARLFTWAEALRIAGNSAAHDVSPNISRQDSKDILEFTEALLQYVFTFTDKFNEFMKRRSGGGLN